MAVPAALPSEAAGIPSGITNPDTRDVSPNSGIVRKEDIPAGIQIRSLDSVDERGETSANPSAILAGIGGDCNGSGACSSTSSSNCRVAFGRYDDKTAYCGYTSHVFGHCTAMLTCSNYNNHCAYGWWLKEQFNKVYSKVLCGTCGSAYIPDGLVIGCRATLNYCSNCKDSN